MSGVFTEQSSYYLAFPQKLAQHLYFRLHEPGHAKRGAAQPDDRLDGCFEATGAALSGYGSL